MFLSVSNHPPVPLCFPTASKLESDEPVSFFQGLKLVMNHGAYIKLITGFLFTSLAFMVRDPGEEEGSWMPTGEWEGSARLAEGAGAGS